MDTTVSNFSPPLTTTQATSEFFEGIFENRQSKIFFICLAIITIPVSLTLNYSVIWYERFGQDDKRTIVNRIFSSLCWTGIEFSILISLPELFRYLYGPLPEVVCWVSQLIKNGIVAQLLCLQIVLIIARHACIFWLKNPAAFNDNFWSYIINIWVVIFSFTGQFVVAYLPGKQPVNYYICTGKNPEEDLEQNNKKNLPIVILSVLTVLLHIYSSFRIYRYKKEYRKKNLCKTCTQANVSQKPFEKQSLSDFTSITVTLAVLSIFVFVLIRVAQADPQDLNKFPNYLFVYWINLGNEPIMSIILLTLSYLRNEKMRKVMSRELKEMLGLQIYSTTN